MTLPVPKTSFAAGEISPSLFGHVDLARFTVGASTMRNLYVGYRGGAYSRAGTEYCAFSKQTYRAQSNNPYPPRLIPFQFNINQGLALEFGHHYMRVLYDGALVTRLPSVISAITQATPPRVTAIASQNAQSATCANPATVGTSYTQGEQVSLSGGTFTVRAVLQVTNTKIGALALNSPGVSGYVPGEIITLAGGTQTIAAKVAVVTTKVAAIPIITFAGFSGTPGPMTLRGSTGTGTRFEVNGVVGGGGTLTSISSFITEGSYTANPNLVNEALTPFGGGGFAFPPLVSLVMGVDTIALTSSGSFSSNPAGGNLTQASSTGSGTGATFNNALMAPNDLTFANEGSYSVVPPNPVAQFSSTGSGTGAVFDVVWELPEPISDGDWVYMSGIGGMTELNGDTYVAQNVAGNDFDLHDVYGDPVPGATFTPYTSGGLAAPIYELTTPYAEEDLQWLKFTQSADQMSIDCVNQDTGTEYEPQDLTRLANDSWQFSAAVSAATVAPPATCTLYSSASGDISYQYVVTAIDPDNGSESIASPIGALASQVNIANTAGTIRIGWSAVPNVRAYNVYKATPGWGIMPPVGSLFGFIGQALGNAFFDTNFVADFNQVPPLKKNPFARGRILGINVLTQGSGYSNAQAVVTSVSGSGLVSRAVIVDGGVSGGISAFVIDNEGENYLPTDTVTITGDGSGATAELFVGAQSGTYPSVPAYFQQRRFHANTINNQDTYYASQPGSYTNYDSRTPTVDGDAIIGNPWAVQVNGIQFMVPMPGGLVVFTGASAQLLTGAGGGAFAATPISPSSQSNQPQSQNGCSPTVPPIRIDSDIVFVQAKNSIYRGLYYQISGNIYGSGDLTIYSTQLFTGYTIVQHAWCEEPYKVLWSVRNDGVLLSFTYLRPEQVSGWARHDTRGAWKSVCAITELPVDRLYLAAQRGFGGRLAYTLERMNDRIWGTTEEVWAVDCGIALPQSEPDAQISASSATGLGACAAIVDLIGGTNYSTSTTAVIVDNNGQGPGTGAVLAVVVVAGVITAINVTNPGSGYVYPAVVIDDPLRYGEGASAAVDLDNTAEFTTTSNVFGPGDVGSVIRMGGGVAVITAYTDAQTVEADITNPIVSVLPGDFVIPAEAGTWTLTAPTSSVGGLRNFSGATFTGLIDGNPLDPTVVPSNGVLPLGEEASAVVVGLGFQAQLQTPYMPEIKSQGDRKKAATVTARIEASRGVTAGSNQVDGSTLTPVQIAPEWFDMADIEDKSFRPYKSKFLPLYTGDSQNFVSGGYQVQGQIAFEQNLPLPMTVLGVFIDADFGDTPDAGKNQKSEE